MSEIVRCIGGELDTNEQEINDNLRINDIVRIRRIKTISVYENFDIPKNNEIFDQYDYKLASITCDGKVFKFLIPFDWTNYQAIVYQFSK